MKKLNLNHKEELIRMTKRYWEKLEEPQIIELDSHLAFIVATEVDLTGVRYGLIKFRGSQYEYEDGIVELENEIFEVDYQLTQNGYCAVDKEGNYID